MICKKCGKEMDDSLRAYGADIDTCGQCAETTEIRLALREALRMIHYRVDKGEWPAGFNVKYQELMRYVQ